jgi:hypothetical protein
MKIISLSQDVVCLIVSLACLGMLFQFPYVASISLVEQDVVMLLMY